MSCPTNRRKAQDRLKTVDGKEMPRRPRQHSLEDESRRALQHAIPSDWVFREQTHDYGIDGEIELFADGEATGWIFKVQLKATDSVTLGALTVRLDSPHCNYYRALGLPVLIVRYQATNRTLFIKWFHSADRRYGTGPIDELAISFGPEDIWLHDTPYRLTAEVQMYHRLREADRIMPMAFWLDASGSRLDEVGVSLTTRAIRDQSLRLAPFLQLVDKPGPESSTIRLLRDSVQVTFQGVVNVEVPVDPGLHAPEILAADALVAVALAFGELGSHYVASRIISVVGDISRLIVEPAIGLRIVEHFLRADRVHDALALSAALQSRGTNDQAIAMIQLLHLPWLSREGLLPPDEAAGVQQHLESTLEAALISGDSQAIATAYYNVASRLRFSDDVEALRHYSLAAAWDQVYAGRSYFIREVGECLFGIGQYELATDMYRRSRELGEPDVLQLEADAEMACGRYAQAARLFDSYVETADSPDPIWLMKRWALNAILANYGSAQKRRPRDAARLLQISAHSERSVPTLEAVGAALAVDALSPRAWFALAVLSGDAERWDEAASLYAISGALAGRDLEIWVNAVACAYQARVAQEQFEMLVASAYQLNGEPLITSLADATSAWPEELRAELIARVSAVAEANPRPVKRKLRIVTPGVHR
jgi:tetratricopeptide (TPR) repeat protein